MTEDGPQRAQLIPMHEWRMAMTIKIGNHGEFVAQSTHSLDMSLHLRYEPGLSGAGAVGSVGLVGRGVGRLVQLSATRIPIVYL